MAMNLLSGLQYVQQQGETGRQRGLEDRFNRLAGEAFNAPDNATRDAAVGQVAVNNPRAAFGLQAQFQDDDDRRARTMTNMARLLVSAPEQARAGLYQNMLPTLTRFGLPDLPAGYDAQSGPMIMETAQAIANMQWGGSGATGPYADLPSDIRSLKLLQENPELAQLDRERRQAGGMVPKLVQTAQGYGWGTPGSAIELAPMGGVAGQGIATPQFAGQHFGNFATLAGEFPGIAMTSGMRTQQRNEEVGGQANSQHLTGTAADYAVPPQLKPAFIARAKQMGYQAIDEGDHIHLQMPRGAAPSGGIAQPYQSPGEQQRLALAQASDARAQQQLSLSERAADRADRAEQRQVAANSVSGRTPNEGERNASGFYQRMVAANAELKRLTDAGYDPTNLRDHLTVGSPVGNFFASNEGQQYHQAAMNWVRANLRKESGAAIGVDEARQEIANYFPQPGDTPDVVRQKANNRLVVEQAMLQAAGRAAPQRATAQPSAAAPLNNPAPQRARNHQTGEVLELRNGQWVPAR